MRPVSPSSSPNGGDDEVALRQRGQVRVAVAETAAEQATEPHPLQPLDQLIRGMGGRTSNR